MKPKVKDVSKECKRVIRSYAILIQASAIADDKSLSPAVKLKRLKAFKNNVAAFGH